MEAIVPTEIGMPMLRIDLLEQLNVEYVIEDLDTAEELREATGMRIASYHCMPENLYNRRVKPERFSWGTRS